MSDSQRVKPRSWGLKSAPSTPAMHPHLPDSYSGIPRGAAPVSHMQPPEGVGSTGFSPRPSALVSESRAAPGPWEVENASRACRPRRGGRFLLSG